MSCISLVILIPRAGSASDRWVKECFDFTLPLLVYVCVFAHHKGRVSIKGLTISIDHMLLFNRQCVYLTGSVHL